MSLRLPSELRARVHRYARSRGIEDATAVRALCAERLNELELADALAIAERWQTVQAVESLRQLERGELELAKAGSIERAFAGARSAERRRRGG